MKDKSEKGQRPIRRDGGKQQKQQEENKMSKTTSAKGGTFPCAQCTKAFNSLNAVRMHVARVHTRTIMVPRQKMSEEERLAKKRAYNRKWRMRKGMKVRPLSQKQNGAAWTQERREKFNNTWANKKAILSKITKPEKREEIEDPRAFINCCPNCGYNLISHYLAAKAAHRYV